MKKIDIVEYADKYAAKLADMLNRSGDNWGGDNTVFTETGVIQEENNSINKNYYLAMVDDEIVGFEPNQDTWPEGAEWGGSRNGKFVEFEWFSTDISCSSFLLPFTLRRAIIAS